MKNSTFVLVASLSLLAAIFSQSLSAKPTRTGTNLKNSKAMPSRILSLEEPDEVELVRQLLDEGRTNEALKAAEAYLEEVERVALRHETKRKYYAWNAYCTILTSMKRFDDAIAACTTAMAFEPGKWSAVNNRGTAKFVAGRLDEALTDYELALSLISETNEPVRNTIEHNISLLETRR